MPELYIVVLTASGVLIAMVAWLPLLLKRAPLSLPIVCLALGAGLFSLPQISFNPLPQDYPDVAERLTEFVVIIALMGAGLKIDRVFSLRDWGVTWRLLGITMMLSMAAIFVLGVWGMGLSVAAAILLAGTLAPTDPVLASDIQVGAPKEGQEDDVRFGLTSEAGLNDGLAFPFVNLAIAMSLAAVSGDPDWAFKWFGTEVLWEVGAGVGIGWLIGWAFGWLTFSIPIESRLAKTGDGFIALSATFVSYGVSELLNCYGFLAVFITALAFRHAERDHDFHVSMHEFIEQIERLAMLVVLILFGGALVSGLLWSLRPGDVAVALLVVFIVRPLTGMVGLLGWKRPLREKFVIAFFGIRGIGSFYYLAYGLNHAGFDEGNRLWGIVGLICLISILLHGVTVTPVMRWLDRSAGRDPDADIKEEV